VQPKALLDMAADDFDAADILYDRKLYPQALSHWQQAIEKTTKALGVVTGFTDIEELKAKIAHRSLKVLLRGLEKVVKVTEGRPEGDRLRELVEQLSTELPNFAQPTEIKETDIEDWLRATEEVERDVGAQLDAIDWNNRPAGPIPFDPVTVRAFIASGAVDLVAVRGWVVDSVVGLIDLVTLNSWAQTCATTSRYGYETGDSNRVVFSDTLPLVRHFNALMTRGRKLHALVMTLVEKIPPTIRAAVADWLARGPSEGATPPA